MRRLIAPFILLGTLALGGPASAKDISLPKSSVDELKAVCTKVGGKFSQDSNGFGCGTNCQGGAGTDCIVFCKPDAKCVAQVIGARRPKTIESALKAPPRHKR
jgi:hypothetical protein